MQFNETSHMQRGHWKGAIAVSHAVWSVGGSVKVPSLCRHEHASERKVSLVGDGAGGDGMVHAGDPCLSRFLMCG